MKIRRFTAPSISEAMRSVKREFGSDAVILSNEAIDDGVEIVCAIDYDEQLMGNLQESDEYLGESIGDHRDSAKTAEFQEALLTSLQGLGQGSSPGARRLSPPKPGISSSKGPLSNGRLKETESATGSPRQGNSSYAGVRNQTGHPRDRQSKQISWSQDPTLKAMQNSLEDLQVLMEEHLMGMVWKEASGVSPKKTALMSRMIGAGFSEALARNTIDQIPADKEGDSGMGFLLALLSRQLRTHEAPLLKRGGIWAMVGPSGSGKTSTLIKLAARFLDQNGPQSVALVGFDLERIGAHQQLKVYSQLLDVPMRSVKKAEELAPTLDALARYPLILIDTAGFSPLDQHLEEQIRTFQDYRSAAINPLLIIPAVMESNYINRSLKMASALGIRQTVLTRFDETMRPGIGLSCLIENGMELSFVGTGRNLVKDLMVAQAPELFSRVAELIQRPRQVEKPRQTERQKPNIPATTIARGTAHGN